MGKLYEVQKYLTLNEHSYSEDIFVISDSFFQRLPADVQQIFVAAGRQAEICDRSADTILMKVTALEVIKKTMKVYSPTSEEKENFKKVSQGPVVQWLKGEVGAEVVDDVLKDIQRIEKRFGY
jgi:TRAP-type C4-dicarboxylate transport system substrate-binding protein